MTLQISVIIWTVISFSVLALVLNRFLFKPLLKVMDSRNSKIDEGMALKKAELDKREKKRIDSQLEREAAQKKVTEDNEHAIEEARTETAERLAAEKARLDAEEEIIIAALQRESDELEEKFSSRIDELALDYVTTIIR